MFYFLSILSLFFLISMIKIAILNFLCTKDKYFSYSKYLIIYGNHIENTRKWGVADSLYIRPHVYDLDRHSPITGDGIAMWEIWKYS